MKTNKLKLTILPEKIAVCRLDSAAGFPAWLTEQTFYSVTRTLDELSIVTWEKDIPLNVKTEPGWRCLKIEGPLDFAMIGVLAGISAVLADAGVSIFVISTYDTDYILVKDADLKKAATALGGRGYEILG